MFLNKNIHLFSCFLWGRIVIISITPVQNSGFSQMNGNPADRWEQSLMRKGPLSGWREGDVILWVGRHLSLLGYILPCVFKAVLYIYKAIWGVINLIEWLMGSNCHGLRALKGPLPSEVQESQGKGAAISGYPQRQRTHRRKLVLGFRPELRSSKLLSKTINNYTGGFCRTSVSNRFLLIWNFNYLIFL